MIKNIILKFIKYYQKTLSINHGPFSEIAKYFFVGCRFYPTCSQYMYQVIEKYGVAKGVLLGIKRILKCNSFSKD